MSSILGSVSALWLFTAFLHAVLGGREILRPVLESGVNRTAKATSEVVWHLITWQFLVIGALGAFSAIRGEHQGLFALLSAASAGGFAALFITYGIKRFGNVWHMPQWALFVPIMLLSVAAPNLAALSLGSLATGARMVAALLLVAIAICHVAWALGSAFPASSHAELTRHVIGVGLPGNKMPGKLLTWLVAGLLFAAAGCVLTVGSASVGGRLAALLDLSPVVLVVVFTARGIGGFFEVAFRPAIRGTPYMTWSRLLYSPLSLLLALLIGVGAQA